MYYFLFLFLLIPNLVFGADGQGGTGGGGGQGGVGKFDPVKLDNPLKQGSIIGLFQDILNVVMVFAVPIVVFFIIYAGFLYVTARGNQETISKAHRALLYAVLGGVLILGANVLITVISGTVDAVQK